MEVLLADYIASRDDNRQQQVQLVALLAVGVSLLAILYGVIFQAAPYNTAPSAIRLSPALVFSLPLIPLVVLAYTASYIAGMTLRGYYMRALEREIAARGGATLEFHGSLPAPSIAHLDVLLSRTGPEGQPRIRLMNNFVGLVPFLGFAGLVALCVIALNSWVMQVSCALFYLPFAAAVFWVGWTTSIKPRKFFLKIYAQLPGEFKRRLAEDNPAKPRQRHLWSYLLMPRLGELSKGVGYIYIAIIFLLAFRSPAIAIRYTLIFWIALEVLAYQARYAWNDLRGLTQDSRHPAKLSRGRIPEVGTVSSRVFIVEVMIAIRVGAAIGLLWLLPAGTDRYMAAAFLIFLFIISVIYEGLRSAFSKDSDPAVTRTRIKEWSVYLAVSLGYGIRGSAGAWFGSNGHIHSVSEAIVFITSAASGGTAVLIVWLYEASVVRAAGQASQPPPAQPAPSRMPAHLAALLGHYDRSQAGQGPASGPLLARNGLPLSPWGTFMLATAALSALLGFDLLLTYSQPGSRPPAVLLPGLLAAGLCLGYLIQRLPMTLAMAAPFTIILATYLALLHLSRTAALLCVLPELICLLSYLTLRAGQYEQLIEGIIFPLKQTLRLVVSAWNSLQWLVLGRATMTALTAERSKRKNRSRGR